MFCVDLFLPPPRDKVMWRPACICLSVRKITRSFNWILVTFPGPRKSSLKWASLIFQSYRNFLNPDFKFGFFIFFSFSLSASLLSSVTPSMHLLSQEMPEPSQPGLWGLICHTSNTRPPSDLLVSDPVHSPFRSFRENLRIFISPTSSSALCLPTARVTSLAGWRVS